MKLNGKVVGFDDKFFNSIFDLGETPPLQQRCHCVIIYFEIEKPILYSNTLRDKFPKVADEHHKLTLILSNAMDADDFAIITKGRLITLNADTYRDTARLSEEYQKLIDEGWFVNGTDYRAIIHHEFGHIVAKAYKIDPLEIACEITV